MKTKLLLLLSIFLILNCTAQTPDWLWAESADGSNNCSAADVCTDVNGDVYITGYFNSPTITFGSVILTNNSINKSDLFVAKYNASGDLVWAINAGGSGNDFGLGICADLDGYIYVTGSFSSSPFVFDTIEFNSPFTLSNIYVAKFNANGNVIWVKGGISSDNFSSTHSEANDVSVDGNGNVMITGTFNSSSFIFDSDTLFNTDPNHNWADIFVTKYDSLGNVLWVKSAGGVNEDEASSIASDGDGNIFITGLYHGSSIIFNDDTLLSVGAEDIFIAKYNTDGALLWDKSAGGISGDYSNGIIVEPNGNIYITGAFGAPSITFDDTTLTCSDVSDIFIVKYDSSGVLIWAVKAGGNDFDEGIAISHDIQGNIYVSGVYTSNTISFENYTLTNANNMGYFDIFIVKYDSSGYVLWAKGIIGDKDEFLGSIVSTPNSNAIITGTFQSSSITFGNTTLTNAGNNLPVVFVAKLDNTVGIETFENAKTITIYPNPTLSKLKITAEEKLTAYSIADITGRIIQSDTINNKQSFEADVTLLSAGIYYLKLETETGSVVRKFVKE